MLAKTIVVAIISELLLMLLQMLMSRILLLQILTDSLLAGEQSLHRLVRQTRQVVRAASATLVRLRPVASQPVLENLVNLVIDEIGDGNIVRVVE